MDALEVCWRKSSYSGGNGGACVEVAQDDVSVLVRDSNSDNGPELPFSSATWMEFLATLK
jgi:Domain of unknown function (DUF397)